MNIRKQRMRRMHKFTPRAYDPFAFLDAQGRRQLPTERSGGVTVLRHALYVTVRRIGMRAAVRRLKCTEAKLTA